MRKFRVDLRSDTVTTPSHGMRQAIAHALVGDDVFREDPTVIELEQRTAKLLGKEAGLFMVSGTMTNGIGLRVLGNPGDELICGSYSHIYRYEGASAALLGGMQLHRIDETETGILPENEVLDALNRTEDIHFAPRSVLTLENTHNMKGGRVLPFTEVKHLLEIARNAGLKLYLDGARLWNASLASGFSMKTLSGGFDMVSVCFSKGLGCPVGSLLAGNMADIERARWLRKRYGGGMRQVGVLAAACIYALEHNISKLPRTHKYAKKLAKAANNSPLLNVDINSVETNIIIVKTIKKTAPSVLKALDKQGIGCFTTSANTIRLVTHLSLTEKDVKYAADTLAVFGA